MKKSRIYYVVFGYQGGGVLKVARLSSCSLSYLAFFCLQCCNSLRCSALVFSGRGVLVSRYRWSEGGAGLADDDALFSSYRLPAPRWFSLRSSAERFDCSQFRDYADFAPAVAARGAEGAAGLAAVRARAAAAPSPAAAPCAAPAAPMVVAGVSSARSRRASYVRSLAMRGALA